MRGRCEWPVSFPRDEGSRSGGGSSDHDVCDVVCVGCGNECVSPSLYSPVASCYLCTSSSIPKTAGVLCIGCTLGCSQILLLLAERAKITLLFDSYHMVEFGPPSPQSSRAILPHNETHNSFFWRVSFKLQTRGPFFLLLQGGENVRYGSSVFMRLLAEKRKATGQEKSEISSRNPL